MGQILCVKKVTFRKSGHNLCIFCFCRVQFGLICSPFLLAATIKFHLKREVSPLALHILYNIYVDNVLIGVDNVNDTHGIYEEAKHIFKKSAMDLREWNSNCSEFLESLFVLGSSGRHS